MLTFNDPESRKLLESVVADSRKTRGSEDDLTLRCRRSLAIMLWRVGDYDAAIAARESLGNSHSRTMVLLNRLGTVYIKKNRLDDGLKLSQEGFDHCLATFDEDHPLTLAVANSLATTYLAKGQYKDAIVQLKRVYSEQIRKRGPDHPETLTIANNLASAHLFNKEYDLAIPIYQQVLATQIETQGPDKFDTIRTMVNLSVTLQSAKRFKESAEMSQMAISNTSKALGEKHPMHHTAFSISSMSYIELGDFKSACRDLEACHALQAKFMPEHWIRFHKMSVLGKAYAGRGDRIKVDKHLSEGLAGMEARKEKIAPNYRFRLEEARQRRASFKDEK